MYLFPMNCNILLTAILVVLVTLGTVTASLSKPHYENSIPSSIISQAARIIPTKPECTFPRLKDRLFRMISLAEPVAFRIILHSECREQVDVFSRDYLEIFEVLLVISTRKDVSSFIRSMMRDETTYSPLMLSVWSGKHIKLPLYVLEILKIYLKHPDGTVIYGKSLEYPVGSEERAFLARWLVELQKSTLKWPFEERSRRFERSSSSSRSLSPNKTQRDSRLGFRSLSPLKSKSLKSNSLSWSQFDKISLGVEDQESYFKDSEDIIKASQDSQWNTLTSSDVFVPESTYNVLPSVQSTLNFGHIYGWVSRKGNPIVRNSNEPFNFYGHSVSLHDTFLGFASSKFNLEDFATAAHSTKSFFIKSNSALSQRIKSSSASMNFAVCRLVPAVESESNFELQAILKGDLNLAVLGALPDGRYDFKYPTNPYQELKQHSNVARPVTLSIAPTDIVLFLPRNLFNDPDNSISPHDIAGAFHYTDLSNFATSFVNFINFVHSKTSHQGLIAVGGFVHETGSVKKKSRK